MSGSKDKLKKPEEFAEILEVPQAELEALVDTAESRALRPEEGRTLRALVATFGFMKAQWQSRETSNGKLLKFVFGPRSEKTRVVLSEVPNGQVGATADSTDAAPDPADAPKPKRKGHGRNAAAAYLGAERIAVPHAYLESGDGCPEDDCKGKVYVQAEPATLIRITGVAPICACIYERARLRCNLCCRVFTAAVPNGVGDEKYDATATAMVGLLKYGTGLPFNRIERLQAGFGIPLPAATQWGLVRAAAEMLAPAHEALINEAANAELVHNDDTSMQVLKITREERAAALSEPEDTKRTGVFTSGILATKDKREIALFFTGPKHAGENLTAVLKRRSQLLPPPIQMSDGLLSRNLPDEPIETLSALCLTHGRRRFVEVAANFPQEVRYVLEILREVYVTDAKAKELALNHEERLALHQKESGPRMEELAQWMKTQFDERQVEPNSGLGEAMRYLQNHWEGLTLFLRAPGAPLDNTACERALKKAILNRNNAYFYRTLAGAAVGDCWMSLIYTAELAKVNPFEYLVALLENANSVAEQPRAWLPWNYEATLAQPATPVPSVGVDQWVVTLEPNSASSIARHIGAMVPEAGSPPQMSALS